MKIREQSEIKDIAQYFGLKYEEAEKLCELAYNKNQNAIEALLKYSDHCKTIGAADPNINFIITRAAMRRAYRKEVDETIFGKTFYERHPLICYVLIMLTIAIIVLVSIDRRCGSDEFEDDYESIGNCKYAR